MDAVAGQPISAMAHEFTRQPGIPLIRVDEHGANGRTTLSLTQAEFSIDQPNKTPLRWQVPVVARPWARPKRRAPWCATAKAA